MLHEDLGNQPITDVPRRSERVTWAPVHIFGWDLDRTYLDTQIHSMRGLLRAAIERPSSKRTVPGAAQLIQGLLAADGAARVRFLSGSPRQLRAAIEQKLAMDGIVFDRLTLKDNLRNLRRGRFRALRSQVGYKLPTLLADRVAVSEGTTETWFGDDSEKDGLIYAVYGAVIAGQLGIDDLTTLLKLTRAYPDALAKAVRAAERIEPAHAVEDIFIRLDRGTAPRRFARLGRHVHPVSSWFQAAMVLHHRGRLELDAVAAVAEDCRLGETPEHWGELVADAVRRRMVPDDVAMAILGAVAPALADATGARLRRMELVSLAEFADVPDYLGFLDLDGAV